MKPGSSRNPSGSTRTCSFSLGCCPGGFSRSICQHHFQRQPWEAVPEHQAGFQLLSAGPDVMNENLTLPRCSALLPHLLPFPSLSSFILLLLLEVVPMTRRVLGSPIMDVDREGNSKGRDPALSHGQSWNFNGSKAPRQPLHKGSIWKK